MLASLSPSKISFSEPNNVKPVIYAKALETSVETKIEIAYNNLHSDKFALPKLESFAIALKGYYSLKDKGLIKKDILTLIVCRTGGREPYRTPPAGREGCIFPRLFPLVFQWAFRSFK